jgi:exosortase A-associated hydrolase 1
MRQMISFTVNGDTLSATLDQASGTTGLLIVSGGNEIRSGAFAGQAAIAAFFAARGISVFRYDRRGIGESEGTNGGFESSADDIAGAVNAFRGACPQITRIVAFGNCDAASALALFGAGLPIDAMILANPWVIEAAETTSGQDAPAAPSAAAIRTRYWNRIKNPRSLIDLFTGKIDLKKLASGLAKAAAKQETSGLAMRIANHLAPLDLPVLILLARRDTTAMAFIAAWQSAEFENIRGKATITLSATDSASHSFADTQSKAWLLENIHAQLK